MATQTLYKSGAFGAGADLWIIPNDEQSSWSHQIDWYLNFLLSRAKNHQTKEIPEDLLKLAERYEVSLAAHTPSQKTPLMIASEHYFPNKQVVLIHDPEDFALWLKQAHQIWQNLGKPSLRVFLPSNSNELDFQKEWPGDLTTQTITLVPNDRASNEG